MKNRGISLIMLIILIVLLCIIIGAIFVITKVGEVLTIDENQESLENSLSDNKEEELLESKIIASQIKANPNKYYGVKINNYNDMSGNNVANVEWRLFYADDEKIYLIANDYVKNSYFNQTGLTNFTNTTENNLYGEYGYGEYGIYLLGSSDEFIKKLTTPDSYNILKDANGYADSVVGAPTIEQFVQSYNSVCTPTIDIKYYNEAQPDKHTTQPGYMFKFNNQAEYNFYIDGIVNNYNGMNYSMKNSSKASAMWLASKSVLGDSGTYVSTGEIFKHEGLVSISSGNSIESNLFGSTARGLRSIVSLKSTVGIIENEDGTYNLK